MNHTIVMRNFHSHKFEFYQQTLENILWLFVWKRNVVSADILLQMFPLDLVRQTNDIVMSKEYFRMPVSCQHGLDMSKRRQDLWDRERFF